MYRTCLLLLVAVACGTSGTGVTPQSLGNLVKDDVRIVGGYNISITEAPYQVAIFHGDTPSLCGGSIINAKAILSAAHCFNNRLDNYYIHYGVTYLGDIPQNLIRADKVVLHEKYDKSTMNFDIAFVFLRTDISFSRFALPIGLATESPVFGALVKVTGWGTLGEYEAPSEALQAVEVLIKPNIVCHNQYENVPHAGAVTDRNLCAGFDCGGKDACQGDSGGPMWYDHQLVGIVSWGKGCANPNYLGVYTSVPALYDWIERTLKYNQCSWIRRIFGLCGQLHG